MEMIEYLLVKGIFNEEEFSYNDNYKEETDELITQAKKDIEKFDKVLNLFNSLEIGEYYSNGEDNFKLKSKKFGESCLYLDVEDFSGETCYGIPYYTINCSQNITKSTKEEYDNFLIRKQKEAEQNEKLRLEHIVKNTYNGIYFDLVEKYNTSEFKDKIINFCNSINLTTNEVILASSSNKKNHTFIFYISEKFNIEISKLKNIFEKNFECKKSYNYKLYPSYNQMYISFTEKD